MKTINIPLSQLATAVNSLAFPNPDDPSSPVNPHTKTLVRAALMARSMIEIYLGLAFHWKEAEPLIRPFKFFELAGQRVYPGPPPPPLKATVERWIGDGKSSPNWDPLAQPSWDWFTAGNLSPVDLIVVAAQLQVVADSGIASPALSESFGERALECFTAGFARQPAHAFAHMQ